MRVLENNNHQHYNNQIQDLKNFIKKDMETLIEKINIYNEKLIIYERMLNIQEISKINNSNQQKQQQQEEEKDDEIYRSQIQDSRNMKIFLNNVENFCSIKKLYLDFM